MRTFKLALAAASAISLAFACGALAAPPGATTTASGEPAPADLAISRAQSANSPSVVKVTGSGLGGFTVTPPANGCTDSVGGPWSSIGLPGRPVWVMVCAERRLRLMPALAGIESNINGQAEAYFKGQGPGLAVGLVLGDGLYFSRGFGFRDATRTLAPTETTVFRAGSFSKVITGSALLTLTDNPANHMSLADPADAQRYLPELKYVCPLFDTHCNRGSQHLGLTLSNLVSHTSGLADVMVQDNANVDPWLGQLQQSYLLFPPNTYNAYSGVGVEGVGLIEQRISGKPYPQFVHDALFAPLGMTHSYMDPLQAPHATLAQRWMFNLNGGVWSFSRDDAMIPGDDQAMILPAGGLTTSVWDLSRFMAIWLTDQAPYAGGVPIISSDSLKNAYKSQVATSTPPPIVCGDTTDDNGYYYSPCDLANGFGVNWYVGNKPYIMHNGDEPGRSGSETVIDQGAKMAATGLVSTEPYPGVPKSAPQYGFVDNVVTDELLPSGLTADKATTWAGQPLPEGVARLLWLSGAKPPNPVGAIFQPRQPQPNQNAGPRARGRPPMAARREVGPGQGPVATQNPLAVYQAFLLAQFNPAFAARNNLTTANVGAFVAQTFQGASDCKTFRVRRAFGPFKAEVMLDCSPDRAFDTTMTVDAAGRIADLSNAQISSDPY